MHATVSGDKLLYEADTRLPVANLLETKILINNVIFDLKRGVKFMCLDIKDYFLAIPIDYPEHM